MSLTNVNWMLQKLPLVTSAAESRIQNSENYSSDTSAGPPRLGLSLQLIGLVTVAVTILLVFIVLGIWFLSRSASTFGKVLRLARPERGLLAAAAFCLLCSTACAAALPLVFGQIIDLVALHVKSQQESALQQLPGTVATLLGASLTFSGLAGAAQGLFSLAGEKLTVRLRQQLFRAILSQETSFFDSNLSGELANRLASDTSAVQTAATEHMPLFLNNAASLFGGVIICLATSWKLFVFILAVTPLIIAIAHPAGRLLERLSSAYQEALASCGAIAVETFGNIRTVRAFACGEQKEISRYNQQLDTTYHLGRRRARATGALVLALGALVQCAIIGSLWLGAWLVLTGAMQPGTLTAFILYALGAAGSLGSLASLYGDVRKALGTSKEIFALLERSPKIPSTLCDAAAGLFSPSSCKGAVELHDVWFAYERQSQAADTTAGAGKFSEGSNASLQEVNYVLRGISLQASPGERVALVGPSGEGKSTIMALLLRSYDPSRGSVSIDGHDLKTLSPSWLRRQVGVVAQEPVLFARSIQENIAYGLPDGVSDVAVQKAARLANADDFVSNLPLRYGTSCGERGVQLSGGQKQRIAIARALLLEPRLLLLDEVTSALDAHSEQLVQEALHHLLHSDAGRPTVFLVAHRLATVQSADKILVVKDGVVAEEGTHEELRRLDGGLYARLAQQQQLWGG